MSKKDSNNAGTNFTVTVLSLIECYNWESKKVSEHVKVRIEFKDAECETLTIPRLELDTFDWSAHNFRCELPVASPLKTKRHIANQIRAMLPEAPVEKIYVIDKLGLHLIGDEVIFCTGSEIIRAPPNKENPPAIEASNIPHRLDFDPSLSKKDAILGMLTLDSVDNSQAKT